MLPHRNLARNTRGDLAKCRCKLPDAAVRKIRIGELAHGRAAFVGVATTGIVGLLTGATLLAQASDHIVPVAVVSWLSGVSVGDDPLYEEDCIQELNVTRVAMGIAGVMVAMELLDL